MQPQLEQSLVVEFEELFALKDRIRPVADQVRSRLLAAGLAETLEAEVFEQELELRGTDHPNLLIRLDSYHLEITGAQPELQTHQVAALILEEAGAFRLPMVEAGFSLTLKARPGHPLNLVQQAFSPLQEQGDEEMLDRRFSMTWDWGTATTGFSFFAGNAEDREIHLSFKVREGYMNLDELKEGAWMAGQTARFDALVSRFLAQLGWQS